MAFNPRFFYRFNSPALNNATLSSGRNKDANGALKMTANGTLSSENWQIFSQEGRFFIRNFDYGSGYQLGLTQNDQTTPRLYQSSGSLAQQWSVVETQEGYQLSNGILGNGTWLDLQGANSPIMQSGQAATVWMITRNPSAETNPNAPNGPGMYSSVQGFEVSQVSSLLVATGSSPLPSSTLPAAPASTSTSIGTSSNLPSSSRTYPVAIAPAAIIGIIVGGVAFMVLLFLSVWFLAHKRRISKQERYELHSHGAPRTEKYAYRAELGVKRRRTELDATPKVVELP